MGTITRSFANNITTSGVLLPASLTNNSIANVTAYNPAIATGNMVLISSQTASNSASISFTTGINSTYKEYQFWFINIKPATDGAEFTFQGSTNGGSSYGVTITSTHFSTYHDEADTGTNLSYSTSGDLAQSTSYHQIFQDTGNGADECGSGSLTLFNPSSTTYVKHFITNTNDYNENDYSTHHLTAGYFNSTSAINAIDFKFTSGNISDGTILMYGIV
jgi:hypothetical protein